MPPEAAGGENVRSHTPAGFGGMPEPGPTANAGACATTLPIEWLMRGSQAGRARVRRSSPSDGESARSLLRRGLPGQSSPARDPVSSPPAATGPLGAAHEAGRFDPKDARSIRARPTFETA